MKITVLLLTLVVVICLLAERIEFHSEAETEG